MIWIAAGVMMIAKRTGRKNMIIGTVSFGGSDAAFLLSFAHAHVPLLFRKDAQRRADRGSVLLGLHEAGDDPSDTIKPSALCEILICGAAVRQIGKLCRGQAEFLGEFGRLRADLLRNLPKRALDCHAGFNTDQQKIECIGPGAADRLLSFG